MNAPDAGSARAPYVRRAVMRASSDHDAEENTWGIAVEAPVEIALNDTPWTVMLATPSDLEDLAVGLALTEGVLRVATAVQQVTISEFLHDVSVNIVAPESSLDLTAIRSRSLLSSTACGLCGLESLAQLRERFVNRTTRDARVVITDDAIRSAFSALPDHQPLNRATRSVHAAAWCGPSGAIDLVREDVGRHNALDKLIGALARRHSLDAPGFIVMSSRCSYELVYKARVANTQLLATISAPTTMALAWSDALSLPLVCCSGGLDVVHFPAEPRTELPDAR